MQEQNIEQLYIYPEERETKHPTANSLLKAFEKISTYQIKRGDQVVEEYKDGLGDEQLRVLELLGLSEDRFWRQKK